ncbi:MAG: choice-of-anchor L domain-containing protein, partial [Flavobacteriaceae bacterium]
MKVNFCNKQISFFTHFWKNRVLSTIILFLFTFAGFSQTTISVNNSAHPESSYTPEQLIKDVLIGAGDCAEVDFIYLQENPIGATNPSQKSWGYFDATGTSFPFDKGIILTTGFASNATGPNNNTGISGISVGWTGDSDLKAILDAQSGDNQPTNNATVFQFTFVPSIPNISFDFIFASEEYENQYECQHQYRDGFAFLLKGPGIPDTSGTTYGGINIAAISGSAGVPVSTISIHSNDFMCGSEVIGTNFFPDLYVSNSGMNNLNEIQYDGHTVPLTAQATLIPGETYELKIVIADRGDAGYDSAVFFKAGSFNIGLNLGDDLTVEDSTAPCNLDTITIGVESKPFEIYQWYAYDGSSFNEIPGETTSYLDVSTAGVYGLELTYGLEECTYFDSVTVEFADNPVAYQPSTLIGCESMSEDGYASFILTDRDAQIINGQTDMTVMYFETSELAEEGNPENQLTIPYTNTEIWGQTIYARIEHIDFGCYDITELDLIVCQPCLENFILNSQAEVDFFEQTYSHCTDVIGDVIVEGEDITDLTGLNSLVNVGGDFTIQSNPSLNELNGLNNLSAVNGNFNIIDNPALSEIAGFSSLNQIDGHFWLKDLPSLAVLSGFTSLNHIGNEFWIQNTELQNLDSLESIVSIGGKLALEDNPSMNNISGLSNINPETILGELGLYITNNPSLSVCSLPNFCTYLNGEGNRTISENAGYCFDLDIVLLDCIPCEIPTDLKAVNIFINTADLNWNGEEELFDIEWGTTGFVQGNGIIESYIGGTEYNLSELMADTKYDFYVRTYCETKQSDWAGPYSFTTLKDCPTGNFTFTSQQQINSFGAEYAHCSDIILNNVTIQGANITNLDGLNKISEIQGFLDIKNNSQLQNLMGLNSLNWVEGNLNITGNTILENLEGLGSLTEIGNDLIIGNNDALVNLSGLDSLAQVGMTLHIFYNPSLLSLNGLNNLTQMEEGYIRIENNGQLNDISDLQDINPVSISEEYGLHIVNNTNLSICDFSNFCTYLQGSGVRTISGNAGNCSDETTLVNLCNG